jgi:hypothetical protein
MLGDDVAALVIDIVDGLRRRGNGPRHAVAGIVVKVSGDLGPAEL